MPFLEPNLYPSFSPLIISMVYRISTIYSSFEAQDFCPRSGFSTDRFKPLVSEAHGTRISTFSTGLDLNSSLSAYSQVLANVRVSGFISPPFFSYQGKRLKPGGGGRVLPRICARRARFWPSIIGTRTQSRLRVRLR